MPSSPPERRVLLAMSLMGAAIIPLEIALVRIFSFTIWHHFAFMVLSVALLGFAVSGTVVRLVPALGKAPLERASLFALLFAASALVSVYLVCRTPFDPGRIELQFDSLLVYYLALLVPFTFAGLTVVILLEANAARAGTLYGFDLAGAGVGAVLAPMALSWLGAEGLVLSAGALAASAALALSWHAGVRWRALCGLALATILAAMPFAGVLFDVRPGAGKGLAGLLDGEAYPSVRLVSSEWNAIGRVDVVEGAPPSSWTQSAGAQREPETDIVIDGDALTPVLPLRAEPELLASLGQMPSTAALQAFAPARVLVLGSGGGVDVAAALHHGAAHVDAVEVNPVIVRLVTDTYDERLDHLFTRPEVTLHHAEGRSFVRQSAERYDLIQISLVDTWAAASSGAYSLAESYLYTSEAFEDYLAHLGDEGVFTITRWLTLPPRESLRLCTVSVEALRRRGARRPADHVAILASGNLATLIVAREPFTSEALDALRAVADARGFEVLHAPGVQADNPLAAYFASADPQAFVTAYPYDVTPVGDDSPFFFQFGRWSDANPLGAGWRDRPTDLSGRLVLLSVLAQASVLSLVLVVFPRLPWPREPAPPGTPGALLYFFLLGVAFMLLEVVLMQRFTLFLGHPLYAMAFVLATLLVSAGAGSLYGRARARASPRLLFAAITLGCVSLAVGLPHLFELALAAPLAVRFAASLAVLAPLGFLLGIPMPLAIERLAAHRHARLVGWAWAGNGAGSVIGPVVAALLAIDLGFTMVTLIAGLAYAVAFFALGPFWADPVPSAPTAPAGDAGAPG